MADEREASRADRGTAGSRYRSFQYLEAGRDYRAFRLAPEVDRVPPEPVPLSPTDEERAERLLATSISISLHDHLEVDPLDLGEMEAWVREARTATGYEGLRRSRLTAVFENFGDGMATITSKAGWKWGDVIHDVGMRYSDWAHQDFVVRAERLADISLARTTGRVAVIPALESASPIENEVDRIDVLYGLGIRMLGVAYSDSNALGSGCRERSDGGLTVFGRRAVERMNRLGMVIDVSHAGDRTAFDTIEASDRPVCISHSGARALWPISKLKPDELIRACAERGGVIGIEAAPGTTMTLENPAEHTLDSFMRHFEYCVELVGIDHVAFGPDTLFGDHAGSYHVPIGDLVASGDSEHDRVEVPWVRGLENPGDFPNIVRWLVKHGYCDAEIVKAIGGNVVRLLEQTWWS